MDVVKIGKKFVKSYDFCFFERNYLILKNEFFLFLFIVLINQLKIKTF